MTQRIAIQGFIGSFHFVAAQSYLGKNFQAVPCTTFNELVKVAQNEELSEGGFMAIENSIAGSILPNYALLEKSKLKISGEIYLQINHHLMANEGVTLSDIREVYSHPMAFLQCIDFLENHSHWKLIEKEDTASSAKYIHQHNHRHGAAIAGREAAEIYKLKVLNPKIQTHKDNYTRFLFLQRESEDHLGEENNKASVSFQTDHSRGALAKVLTKIASHNINLSKLQSIPIPGKVWQYIFHADMEFDSLIDFNKAMQNIKKEVGELRIFGVYKKGLTV